MLPPGRYLNWKKGDVTDTQGEVTAEEIELASKLN